MVQELLKIVPVATFENAELPAMAGGQSFSNWSQSKPGCVLTGDNNIHTEALLFASWVGSIYLAVTVP